MTTIKRTVLQPTRYGDNPQKNKKSKSPRSKSSVPTLFPEINERFKKIRSDMGITQKEMADKLSSPGVDISESSIKAIENNVVSINIYTLRRLRRISGRSYDYILDGGK